MAWGVWADQRISKHDAGIITHLDDAEFTGAPPETSLVSRKLVYFLEIES